MPADFANVYLAAILPAFMAKYPAIKLELDLSPRRVDLVAENFDIAIRMGALPDDATLAARKVLISTWGLYAATSYTVVHGLPEHPDDLFKHELLSLRPHAEWTGALDADTREVDLGARFAGTVDGEFTGAADTYGSYRHGHRHLYDAVCCAAGGTR